MCSVSIFRIPKGSSHSLWKRCLDYHCFIVIIDSPICQVVFGFTLYAGGVCDKKTLISPHSNLQWMHCWTVQSWPCGSKVGNDRIQQTYALSFSRITWKHCCTSLYIGKKMNIREVRVGAKLGEMTILITSINEFLWINFTKCYLKEKAMENPVCIGNVALIALRLIW